MLVYVVAAVESLFYLLAVPVHLSLMLDGLSAGTGVSAFDADAAVRRSRRALDFSGERGAAKSGFGHIWPVLRRLRFDSLELTGRISLGDAAATAIVCGGLNGLGGSLRGRATRMRVAVQPDFSDRPRMELRGMACARSGQIMLAIMRNRKGRIHPWRSIPLKAS